MNRSRVTTDHEEIRTWAEARNGRPAAVKRTKRGKDDTGMIRIDFPGYSGAKSLEPISWESWFQKFDDSKLAIILQDETAGGEQSNFNKLIARESVKDGHVDKTKSRRARKRGAASARSTKPRSTQPNGRTQSTQKRSHGEPTTQKRGHTTPAAAKRSTGTRTTKRAGSTSRTRQTASRQR